MSARTPKIWILTDEKQIGKTTFLQQWIAKRHDVIGVLSPIVAGKRFFYNIENKTFTPMEISTDDKNAILCVGRFEFSKQAFAEINEYLFNLSSTTSLAKWLIIDEIGILELERQQGLYVNLINILSKPLKADLLLVVRISLLQNIVSLIHHYHKEYTALSLSAMKLFLANLEH